MRLDDLLVEVGGGFLLVADGHAHPLAGGADLDGAVGGFTPHIVEAVDDLLDFGVGKPVGRRPSLAGIHANVARARLGEGGGADEYPCLTLIVARSIRRWPKGILSIAKLAFLQKILGTRFPQGLLAALVGISLPVNGSALPREEGDFPFGTVSRTRVLSLDFL